MQQQLTHELKYKSEKALLIIGTVPSGPFTNEDEVQRVMCDWAFNGTSHAGDAALLRCVAPGCYDDS